jgi:1D-myo-inositol 3-kinase
VIDYLIVGHVAKDVTADGFTLGGTVTYAGLTALRLGARVGIVTASSEDLDLVSSYPGARLRVVTSATTTTFENTYSRDGRRTQRLLARANCIGIEDVPETWRSSPIVHLAPLAAEFGPELVSEFPEAGVVGLTPQGWMRRWDADRIVLPVEPPELDHPEYKRLDAVIVSDADFGYQWTVIERFATSNRLTIVTRGDQGARLYADGQQRDFAAYRANVVDPTGAGDVFAAAFLLRWRQTGNVDEAMDFANCAASFSVEGIGTSALPDIAAIAARRGSG